MRKRTPAIGAPEHLAAGRSEPEPELRAFTVAPERLAEDGEPRVIPGQTVASRGPRSASVARLEHTDLPFGGHAVRIGRQRDHERTVGVCRVDREREAEPARKSLGDLVPGRTGVVAAVHAPVELHEESFGRRRRSVQVVDAECVRPRSSLLRQVPRNEPGVPGRP